MEIRKIQLKDLKEAKDIYNEEIKTSTATFNIEERTNQVQEKWFEEHTENYPAFVVIENSEVIGWSSLSKWSDREAYRRTAELSIYLSKKSRGKGVGKKLMIYTLDRAKELPLHTVISWITSDNEISIIMHEKYGFKNIGVMKEVGEKFGRLLDVVMMQKMV